MTVVVATVAAGLFFSLLGNEPNRIVAVQQVSSHQLEDFTQPDESGDIGSSTGFECHQEIAQTYSQQPVWQSPRSIESPELTQALTTFARLASICDF